MYDARLHSHFEIDSFRAGWLDCLKKECPYLVQNRVANVYNEKTQQFIKSVKGVTVTRVKQQIFFTDEHSLMTVGTMGRPYKAIYLIQ